MNYDNYYYLDNYKNDLKIEPFNNTNLINEDSKLIDEVFENFTDTFKNQFG